MPNGIGVTQNLTKWIFQKEYVERVMDNAAYSTAHPDDTLILAGPARRASVVDSASGGLSSLLAIGMLQTFTVSQTKPTQPLMAVGSGRSFFVSGKASTQWNMARLFMNGRSLLRVLCHNAFAAGLDPSMFDDEASLRSTSKLVINLDSELYLIPMGLGMMFRDKVHSNIGSMYIELSMITSWALAITAGQSMIMENVTGVADRVLPWGPASATGGQVSRATVDAVLDFVDGTSPINPDNTDVILESP